MLAEASQSRKCPREIPSLSFSGIESTLDINPLLKIARVVRAKSRDVSRKILFQWDKILNCCPPQATAGHSPSPLGPPSNPTQGDPFTQGNCIGCPMRTRAKQPLYYDLFRKWLQVIKPQTRSSDHFQKSKPQGKAGTKIACVGKSKSLAGPKEKEFVLQRFAAKHSSPDLLSFNVSLNYRQFDISAWIWVDLFTGRKKF